MNDAPFHGQVGHYGPASTMDHEVGRTMEDGLLPMVRLSWSDFLKKYPIYEAFGRLTGCKQTGCGPRGMTMHQIVNVLILKKMYIQKGHF